jgi:hypothetical protein
MSPTQRYAKQQANATHRRRLTAHERFERERRQAQRAAEALHQALEDLGLPTDLVPEIEGRLRSQQKLLGKIVGVMFPSLFGCRTNTELCRVRGWDKNLLEALLALCRSWSAGITSTFIGEEREVCMETGERHHTENPGLFFSRGEKNGREGTIERGQSLPDALRTNISLNSQIVISQLVCKRAPKYLLCVLFALGFDNFNVTGPMENFS